MAYGQSVIKPIFLLRNLPGREVINEKGFILVAGLLLISVLMLAGTTSVIMSTTDIKISDNYKSYNETLYAAEGGAEYGTGMLRSALQVSGASTAGVLPPAINGFSFATTGFLAVSGGIVQKTVTGNYAGLTAWSQKYIITSTAVKTGYNTMATIIYDLEDQLIPIFQFGIFYNNDLELHPEDSMSLAGRIHSNKDIYVSTGNTLSVDSHVSAAGKIFRKRKEGTAAGTGTVRIRDAGNNYHALNMDSDSTDWKSLSQARWGGTVKSEVHGIRPVNLVLSAGNQPIDILGSGSESLRQKSGLRIINGIAYDRNNSTVNLAPAGSGLTSPISTAAFFDVREERNMSVIQIDIALLRTNTAAMASLNDPPADGEPGILYVSSNHANPAVRLVNGSGMPAGGLTVVTDNPLYIMGDYNTANAPAGIFADAVTVLSGNWIDVNSNSGISGRIATDTTVRAAVMTGNRNTVGTRYSGGAENLIRFLENWSGRTFTYSGSLSCLWQSQQAAGNNDNTGTVYNPPIRIFSLGMSVSNMPPGTPRVRNLHKVAWRQAN